MIGGCDNCDKRPATHFRSAESACPVYCDSYLCCDCNNCDDECEEREQTEIEKGFALIEEADRVVAAGKLCVKCGATQEEAEVADCVEMSEGIPNSASPTGGYPVSGAHVFLGRVESCR